MEEIKAIAKYVEGFRLQDLLREIYGDAAKSGAKQVGKALETVFSFGNTLLLPFALANERANVFRRNMEKYREKIQETPVDDVCEVSPEIGVPITEKLSYVTNEELSEMFVELLAKASHFKSANVAHPSFVNIINSVSPDEVILLKSIRHTPLIPCIEVRLQKINANQYNVLDPLVVELPCLSELAYPGNVAAYFSNLEGLGIVSVLRDSFMVGDNIYEPIESLARERYAKISESASDGELSFRRRQIEFTSFGSLFLEACFAR